MIKFIDSVRIEVSGGRGGNGCISFRRTRNSPFGGPSGGNGGRGGNVYGVSRIEKNNLGFYGYQHRFCAGNGKNGLSERMSGRSGKDILLEFPVGTLFKEYGRKDILFELTECNQKIEIARGGRGGIGNGGRTARRKYLDATGEHGEKIDLQVELKILSDVGLLGMPNVGKSTLVSQITNAKTKVGNYCFTTLKPQLGIIKNTKEKIVITDIPGIIKNSSIGFGLGYNFLRHLERSRLLVQILDAESRTSPIKQYEIAEQELKNYSISLLNKPRWIVLNKIDLVSRSKLSATVNVLKSALDRNIFLISAKKGLGCRKLVEGLVKYFYPIYHHAIF